ncbi:MAG: DUF2304 domain-containing protein [Candidatus Komeilibacteria bacterium]|nr:DUF2304 domain-containing protein [Candidatus Komeilibacteria bacterium]
MLIQLLVTLFIVLSIVSLITRRQRGQIGNAGFIGWGLLWILIGVAFWLPDTTSFLANMVGIGRGVDLAVYIAIVVLFYLLFRLSLQIKQQQTQITLLARKIALQEKQPHDTD